MTSYGFHRKEGAMTPPAAALPGYSTDVFGFGTKRTPLLAARQPGAEAQATKVCSMGVGRGEDPGKVRHLAEVYGAERR